MVDLLIKKLNQRLAQTISNVTPGQQGPQALSRFDQILNNKQNEIMFEKLSEAIQGDSHTSNKMQTLSAEDIKINIQEGEFGASTSFDAKQTVSQLFSTINNDALKMDSIIEVLASDDVHLSRRQLLAYQASIGTLTINTELFSKLAQSLSQNLNTLLQTNLG